VIDLNKLSVDLRSKNMKAIKSKDTSIEIRLRSELWRRGLRYRKNFRFLPGKPDIVFIKKRVAIFCDSEFWHGKTYLEGNFVKSNISFWEEKMKRNIARDLHVNSELEKRGFIVLRVWSNDINNNLVACLSSIIQVMNER